MKTLNTILTQVAAIETVETPKTTVRSSLRELKGLIGNTIVTAVSVGNEALSIANDVVSAVPVMVQGSKEVVSLTWLFARAVTLNSMLTEKQIESYNALNADQRVAFRRALTEKGGHDLVNAITELFAEEEVTTK